jgi:hypothetical protein
MQISDQQRKYYNGILFFPFCPLSRKEKEMETQRSLRLRGENYRSFSGSILSYPFYGWLLTSKEAKNDEKQFSRYGGIHGVKVRAKATGL